MFFLQGYPEYAKPFYQVAASTEVGAEAELQGRVRAAILDGRWQTAHEASLRRIRSYKSHWAKRDAVGALFLQDKAADGTAMYEQYMRDKPKKSLWEAGLVVHRSSQQPVQPIEEWAKAWHSRDGKLSFRGLSYLSRHYLTDRLMPADFPARWEAVYGPTMRHGYRGMEGGLVHGSGMTFTYVETETDGFKSYYAKEYPDTIIFEFPNQDAIWFKAHREVQLGNYEEAADLYLTGNRMHRMLWHRNASSSFALALAAGGGLDTLKEEIQPVLERRDFYAKKQNYRMALAGIVYAAFTGDEVLATDLFNLMNSVAIQDENRIMLYDYDIVFTLDRVAEETGNPIYREWATRWARATSTVKPWLGWPWAYLAVHAPNQSLRSDALEKALYLDKDSLFLSKISPRKRRQVAKQLKEHPFPVQRSKEEFLSLQLDEQASYRPRAFAALEN